MIDEELTATLREIATVGRSLKTKSDGMNAAIIEVETRLVASTVGVVAYVPIDAGNDIGFDRYGDGWRIVIRNGKDKPTPLVGAPRAVRARAVLQLGALARGVHAEASALLAKCIDPEGRGTP